VKKNLIQEKSYAYALSIVSLYKYLVEQKKEYVLSKQILLSWPDMDEKIPKMSGETGLRGLG
jgi:hypothetical protein